MQYRFLRHAASLGAALSFLLLATQAGAQVQGAGASFPSKVYDRWAQSYAKEQGRKVTYKATGSGDGIKQITARTVDFAGTDSPLSNEELVKRHLVQLPMLIGGIVPVLNVPGIASNKMILSGEVLAGIMSGRITKWNDASIANLNPGLKLPSHQILRIVRSDKSGTTEGFTRYLAESSVEFKSDVGVGQLPNWPGEVTKADGNDGIVTSLKAAEFAVAYVSYDRVVKDGLASVRLKNPAGQTVAASEVGFRAAIVDSDVARKGDDLASLLNRASADAWPITLTSFTLIDAEPADSVHAGETMKFLYWCFMHGDALTHGTGFAPLPINLQARLAARFLQVKPKDGKLPVYRTF